MTATGAVDTLGTSVQPRVSMENTVAPAGVRHPGREVRAPLPPFGSLDVTKIADWRGVSPDTSQTFEICIQSPSYPNGAETGASQIADYDDATLTWNDIVQGDYTVTETEPGSAWIEDVSGSPATLVAGETAEASVTNTIVPSTLTVIKEVVNDEGGQETAAYFELFVYTQEITSGITYELETGVEYTVSEIEVDGYELTRFWGDCAADGTITLEPGQDAICYLENDDIGPSITVVKEVASGNTEAEFGFSLNDGDPFTLKHGEQEVSADLQAGTNVVLESLSPIWRLDAVTRVLAGTDQEVESVEQTDNSGQLIGVALELTLDQDVVCTFFNDTRYGKITIVKDAIPDGAQDFDFTISDGGHDHPFQLDDDGGTDATLSYTKSFTVTHGLYSFTEAKVDGWDLDGIECVGTGATGQVDQNDSQTVNIDIEAGGEIACTFTNKERGKIIVEKETEPGGDPTSFGFSGDLTASLKDGEHEGRTVVPGTYTVRETVPSGWALTAGITCSEGDSGGDTATATATYRVKPGETVLCTFTNAQQGTITVEKQTVPDGSDQAFTYSGAIKTQLKDGQNATVPVAPGSYSVWETVPADWQLTSIQCDDSDSRGDASTGVMTFKVKPGEDVTCIFTNTQDEPYYEIYLPLVLG